MADDNAFVYTERDMREIVAQARADERKKAGERSRAMITALTEELLACHRVEREQCAKEVAATARWCREDERETIASLLEDYGYGDAAQITRDWGT